VFIDNKKVKYDKRYFINLFTFDSYTIGISLSLYSSTQKMSDLGNSNIRLLCTALLNYDKNRLTLV